jgi:hypothetical protein
MATDNPEQPLSAESELAGAARPRAWRRRRLFVFGLLVGLVGVMALAAIVSAVVVSWQDRAPRLTRADYEAAAKRWEANGPASYNLDLELAGRRGGKIHVEVRDGEVTRMTRDGIQPMQKRTWYYWSVPGQFDTIEQELDMARDAAASYGMPAGAEVAMWAEFDPKYGYPRRFDRVLLGADIEVHWKVTRFEIVSKKSDGS